MTFIINTLGVFTVLVIIFTLIAMNWRAIGEIVEDGFTLYVRLVIVIDALIMSALIAMEMQ